MESLRRRRLRCRQRRRVRVNQLFVCGKICKNWGSCVCVFCGWRVVVPVCVVCVLCVLCVLCCVQSLCALHTCVVCCV